MHEFAIESYGVRIRFSSNRKREIERMCSVANTVLIGNVREILSELAEHHFRVLKTNEGLRFELDGEFLGDNPNRRGFYHYFGARVKLIVAEHAKDHIFIHAGVIGWKGKGVLFPADSFQGKTTLIAELIKRGATYYSDDYAVLDLNGLVHPFARRLSMRDRENVAIRREVAPTSLGAAVGDEPLSVDAVILTYFKSNGRWKPKRLTPGLGLMEIIPFTIPLKTNTNSALAVLKSIANRAIIAKSSRNDVERCVLKILDYIDKVIF